MDRIGVAFVVLTSAVFPAAAANHSRLPQFDVGAACNRAALDPREKGEYRDIYSSCISSEQEAYDKLRQVWHTVEDRVVDYCNGAYGQIGASSKNFKIEYYQVYDMCISFLGPGYFQGISDRDKIRQQFKFQR